MLNKQGIKMQKILLTLVIAMIAITPVNAQTATKALVDPGMTPDNFFYFIDGWGESIDVLFTFNKESKVEKELLIAEEKLAEARAMAEKGNEKALEKAQAKYEKIMERTTKRAKEMAKGKENALMKIEEAIMRHQTKMNEVLSKVPDQAKESIQKAIENSDKGYQQARESISKETPSANANAGIGLEAPITNKEQAGKQN